MPPDFPRFTTLSLPIPDIQEPETHDIPNIPRVRRARRAGDDAAAAHREPHRTNRPDPAHTTVVTGRVLDADGKPVAGGQVALVAELWARSERSIGACYVNDVHFPLTFRVTGPYATDEQGRFRGESPFGPARPGYRLSANAAAAGQGQATVELAKGLSSQTVEIKLPREHMIRGRIVDTQGQPAAGATVRPIMVSALGTTLQTLVPTGPTPPYASPLLPAVTTDDKGRFVIRGLGNNKVWLEVTHKALATQRAAGPAQPVWKHAAIPPSRSWRPGCSKAASRTAKKASRRRARG